MRSFGAPAVCASAVAAGIIASSSGSASVTPAPLSTVRRERCFFVRNMRTSETYVVSGFSRTARPPKGGRYVRSTRLHPKRLTRDDPRHDRQQPGVDRGMGLLVRLPPSSDRVQVLQRDADRIDVAMTLVATRFRTMPLEPRP